VSADERRQMELEVDAKIERVKKVIARAEARSLKADEQELLKNARTYLNEAEQERQRDLPTAVSLATRADRFATDLSARLPQ
jgi:hypothetical protein